MGNVVWLDIPVTDLNRAMRFYGAVLGKEAARQQMPGMEFAVLPHGEGQVGACLVPTKDNAPSAQGPLVYISCEGRLEAAVAAVETHGGKVLTPKHPIGPYGFRAVILDSEGNRIALHSM